MLMNKINSAWMDGEYVSQFFGGKERETRRAYQALLDEEMGIERAEELMGGRLIRSQGCG